MFVERDVGDESFEVRIVLFNPPKPEELVPTDCATRFPTTKKMAPGTSICRRRSPTGRFGLPDRRDNLFLGKV